MGVYICMCASVPLARNVNIPHKICNQPCGVYAPRRTAHICILLHARRGKLTVHNFFPRCCRAYARFGLSVLIINCIQSHAFLCECFCVCVCCALLIKLYWHGSLGRRRSACVCVWTSFKPLQTGARVRPPHFRTQCTKWRVFMLLLLLLLCEISESTRADFRQMKVQVRGSLGNACMRSCECVFICAVSGRKRRTHVRAPLHPALRAGYFNETHTHTNSRTQTEAACAVLCLGDPAACCCCCCCHYANICDFLGSAHILTPRRTRTARAHERFAHARRDKSWKNNDATTTVMWTRARCDAVERGHIKNAQNKPILSRQVDTSHT